MVVLNCLWSQDVLLVEIRSDIPCRILKWQPLNQFPYFPPQKTQVKATPQCGQHHRSVSFSVYQLFKPNSGYNVNIEKHFIPHVISINHLLINVSSFKYEKQQMVLLQNHFQVSFISKHTNFQFDLHLTYPLYSLSLKCNDLIVYILNYIKYLMCRTSLFVVFCVLPRWVKKLLWVSLHIVNGNR